MRDRPIIFNSFMVKAIKLGKKTQTRWVSGAKYNKGDVLWIRETHFISDNNNIFYKADYNKTKNLKWRSSIYMKKEHSRINLKVESVRYEPLQSISKEDSIKEGFSNIEEFKELWDNLNKDNNKWDSNPNVYVVTFEVIE